MKFDSISILFRQKVDGFSVMEAYVAICNQNTFKHMQMALVDLCFEFDRCIHVYHVYKDI